MLPEKKAFRFLLFLLLTACFVAVIFLLCRNLRTDSETVVLSPPEGSDTLAWYTNVLQEAEANEDFVLQAAALDSMGKYSHFRNLPPDSGLSCYEQLLTLSRLHQLPRQEVRALEKIALCQISSSHFDVALDNLNEALNVSVTAGDSKSIAWALQELGIFHTDEHDYGKAMGYFLQELGYDTLLKDSFSILSCYSNIAIVHYNEGKYDSSVISYNKAISIAEKIKNDSAAAACHANVGMTYKNQAMYDLALKHLFAAANFYESQKLAKKLSTCFNSIGNTYLELDSTSRAIKYFEQSLHLRDSLGDRKGVASTLTNLGQAYIQQNNYDTALNLLEQSLVIKEDFGDPLLIATTLDLLGEATFMKQDFEKAEQYYFRSLALREPINDPKGKATTLTKLGELYYKWGKEQPALNNLDSARTILEKIEANKVLLQNYGVTVDLYHQRGDMKMELVFKDKFNELKDTILNIKTNKALKEAEVKYGAVAKEQEINLLNERERASTAVVARQVTLIYSLIGGTALLGIIILLVIRSRRTALKQSRTIIEQKQTMLRELHHRVKNNLQVLSGILELQQNRIADSDTRDLMKAIDQRLSAMLLIHQGLYRDQISSQVNMKEYVNSLVANLCSSFGYHPDEVVIKKNVELLEVDADKALSLGFICNEVISNWFKHAQKNKPQAELTVDFSHGILRFVDNGPGIPNNIDPDTSNSFGLRLIRLFSQDLGAELKISSDQNGTVITLILSEQKK